MADPVHGLRMAVRVAISVVDRIPRARLAQDSLRAQEWVERQACRPRECPPNPRDVQVRLRAVLDSGISMGRKKAR